MVENGGMNIEEEQLSKEADVFVKKKWEFLKNKFADESIFPSVDNPTSLFMAGSPGAGKTEVSKRLLEEFKAPVVRIDADEIRVMFNGYNGNNAEVFQHACGRAVKNLYNHCLKRSKNLLLDATFAYKGSLDDISASIKKGRRVQIFFIFQEPLVAWGFTQAREKIDRRHVTREVFLDAYFDSIKNVNAAKEQFGSDIDLNLIIKNLQKEKKVIDKTVFKIEGLDSYLPKRYNREELGKLIP